MIDRYRRMQREFDQRQGDEDGFTLIELLIVIVVLGILAAVTVFGLSGVTGQSLTSACHADAKSVAVAQEAYRAQTGGTSYAANTAALVGAGQYLRSDPGLATAPNAGKYLVHTDTTGAVYVATAATPGGLAGAGVDFEKTVPDPCAGL